MKYRTTANGDSITGIAWKIVLGISLAGFAALESRAEIIYNNSTNDTMVRFDPGTFEVGDQIIMTGNARYLTNFSFEYWGTSTTPSAFAGTVEACVRFYQNDGDTFNGYVAPGTKFYDSGWFKVDPSERSVLVFTAGSDNLPYDGLFIPASEFTWSVQFRGLGDGDKAGIDLYGPSTTGQNYPDYWVREAAGWQLEANTTGDINFAAVMEATQTPILPTMQMSMVDGKAIVSWPAWATSYELLTSSDVTAANWDLVTTDIHLSGGNYVRTNTVVPGSNAFFRLHKAQ